MPGHSPIPARVRLIDAGAKLVGSRDGTLIKRAMSAEVVCSVAGLSRRTFYDNFATVEDYTTELTQRLRAVSSPRAVSLDHADGDLHQAVMSTLQLLSEWQARDEAASAALVLAFLDQPMEPKPSAATWSPLIDELALLGFSPRSLTDHVLAGAIDATWRAANSLHEWTLEAVGASIVALLASALSAASETSTSRSIAEFERQVLIAWREQMMDAPVVSLRRMVLDAFTDDVRERGLAQTTLSTIARRVGLSEGTIARYVGSIQEMSADSVEDALAGLAAALDESPSTMTPDKALHSHIARLVRLGRLRPEFVECSLSLRATRTWNPSTTERRLHRRVADLIEQLIGNRSATPDEFASVIHQEALVLSRALSRLSPELCADLVLRAMS